MFFNKEWLNDFLETTADTYEICEKLNSIGLEVEKDLPDRNCFDNIVVAEVLECINHPDSDHLHVCKVSDGKETYQIVCGAPNVRQGIKVALALIGAYIPGKDFKIKKSKIRGVDSCGMMCSEKEMCIGSNHDGIMELPQSCKIGEPWIDEYKALEKIPVEISITPNRGDATSVYGIARDLSASGLGKLKKIETKKIQETIQNKYTVKVNIDNCKYYCREIQNVNVNIKTPDYILKRNSINGCGDNGIIVNILNYIMFTYGQPMHSYDSDKIGKNIVIDYAKNDTFLTLKNENIKYNKDKVLAVNDDNGEICIAGIIGGNKSKTTNETKNILLESAYFPTTPITISGQELNIVSDARFRYERGINPDLTEQMLDLAANMILEICGGQASNIVSNGSVNDERKIIYPIDFTKKILGFDVEKNKIIDILTSLQFKVNDNSNSSLEITIPRFRHDVEVPADIAEEIARIEGYNKIPTLQYKSCFKFTKNIFKEKIKAKKFLASKGLTECISMSFCNKNKAQLFTSINNNLLLTNPMSDELNYMRPSLILSLLDVISNNESSILENQFAFFEEGMIFTSTEKQGQHNSIAGVYYGNAIQNNHLKESRLFDIFDAKKTLFELLEKIYYINSKNLKILKCEQQYTHPTRSFDVITKNNGNNTIIARFGEISPIVLKHFKIKNTVCFFEVFTDLLPKQKIKNKRFIENNLQPIVRDIAYIVDNSVKAEQILHAYKDELIMDIDVVDIYKKPETEQKSIAVRYVFQPNEQMTTEQINDLMNKIIKSVETKTGGKVRDGK